MYTIITTIVAIIGVLGTLGLLVKDGHLHKILAKLGLGFPKSSINWTASSWESCLLKMDCKADVVFFGDSITRGGNFHLQFPHKRIVNLGSSGDTLLGMLSRVSTVKILEPKQVFFLGGINGLTDYNRNKCIRTYERVIDRLQKELPDATIYVHSVLPIAKKLERSICKNSTIAAFNRQIEELAQRKGIAYIDLYSQYMLNGAMNPCYPKPDGLHLLPESYGPWYKAIEQYLNETVTAE